MISPVEGWMAERTGLLGSLDAESLGRWQMERLRETLAYARDRGRFYGETLRGVDARSIEAPADLGRLPFTRPSDVVRDPSAFLCVPQTEVARVTSLTTSGTSGAKKRVFFTQNDLRSTVDFFGQGMRTMVVAGQHTLILMPGESENSIGRLLETACSEMGATASISRPSWTVRELLEAARGADCIVGIPGEIIYLCRIDGTIRPKIVLLSADYAPLSVIRGVERTWQCPVLTHFGMTETGFGAAMQCRSREGHHLRAADLFIEIVDPGTGRILGPGEPGEIVFTTLRNEAMPLVRYRTGDLSRLQVEPCACGGILPRLGRVEGRRENDLSLSGGGTVSIHQLDEMIFALPAVRGFNAVLRREGRRDILSLTVDADEPIDQGALRARLPGNPAIEVQYAEVNPFVPRAKRRIHAAGRECRP